MKKVMYFFLALGAIALFADPALAQEMVTEASGAAGGATKVWYFVAIVVTCGFSMGIAASFCALGQSKAIVAALEGIARQPSAANKLFNPMIIGLALIESLAIYVLLIALILFFMKPFDPTVIGL